MQNGEFLIGVNYWSSKSGIKMWSEWDETVIDNDLKLLSQKGNRVLRVFPLWSDFQPLSYLTGIRHEMRRGELAPDDSEEGKAGVDPVMVRRFEIFCEIARKYGIRLIVSLLTGWMSGRMFFPPAFSTKNVILDPLCVKWELKFIRYFVRHFKDNEVILAWEPGNEVNCMSAPQDESFYIWLNNIVMTIKSEDSSRPVYAGMHGLTAEGGWLPLREAAEICDLVTTHPYPAFVPHCFTDGLESMKSRMHATAESSYYKDVSGIPCICEEVGTLSNHLGCEEVAAKYARASMYSLWANGHGGFLWWCAFDMPHLDYAPYDWCDLERELGIFRGDLTAKPIADEISRFAGFIDKYGTLPPKTTDAVCLLPMGTDTWGAALSVSILSKQAGFDVKFIEGDAALPDSDIYILPSLSASNLRYESKKRLLEKVREGATLYVSWNDAIIAPFEEITGAKVKSNSARSTDFEITLKNGETFKMSAPRKTVLMPFDAEVLASEQNENPALLLHRLGKGKIYFLTSPLETALADIPYAFSENSNYYKLYEFIFADKLKRKVISKSDRSVGITEHKIDESSYYLTVIDYEKDALKTELTLSDGWQISEVPEGYAKGSGGRFTLHSDDCFALIKIIKKD